MNHLSYVSVAVISKCEPKETLSPSESKKARKKERKRKGGRGEGKKGGVGERKEGGREKKRKAGRQAGRLMFHKSLVQIFKQS